MTKKMFCFRVALLHPGSIDKVTVDIEADSEEKAFGLLPETVKGIYPDVNWHYDNYFSIEKASQVCIEENVKQNSFKEKWQRKTKKN